MKLLWLDTECSGKMNILMDQLERNKVPYHKSLYESIKPFEFVYLTLNHFTSCKNADEIFMQKCRLFLHEKYRSMKDREFDFSKLKLKNPEHLEKFFEEYAHCAGDKRDKLIGFSKTVLNHAVHLGFMKLFISSAKRYYLKKMTTIRP